MRERILKKISSFLIVLLLTSLTSCTKVTTSGHDIDMTRVEKIKIGDTMREVVKHLGSPTYYNKYGDTQYIYIQETLLNRPVFAAKLQAIDIVVVTFNDTDTVHSIQSLDHVATNDAIKILHDREVIKGNSIHPLRQIIGNIGKYNTGREKAHTPSMY